MSVVNDRTGRHEDDLQEELFRAGSVRLEELLAHLQEIVVEDVSGQSDNVRTPVKMATLLLEGLVRAGVLNKDMPISL